MWLALPLVHLVGSAEAKAPADRVVVFAAVSLTEALNEVSAAFEARTGIEVVVSYAASSTLARQIEAGAPADLFVSAHVAWMDYLDDAGWLVADTRENLVGNRLVLVAAAGEPRRLVQSPEQALVDYLGSGHLAMGDPDHVPAGIYAKAALETYGLWKSVAHRAAPAVDVRAAMTLVARGESPLGIGYASDAVPFAELQVVATFPPESHPPIVYPVAMVKEHDSVSVRDFYSYLISADSREVFLRYGFSAP